MDYWKERKKLEKELEDLDKELPTFMSDED